MKVRAQDMKVTTEDNYGWVNHNKHHTWSPGQVTSPIETGNSFSGHT